MVSDFANYHVLKHPKMNIQQIKTQLGIIGDATLDLYPVKDKEGVVTAFSANWDNTTRTRVIAHQDTLNAAKAGSTELVLKTSTKASKESGEVYTEIFIIIPTTKPSFSF
jgi:hypothetical protein